MCPIKIEDKDEYFGRLTTKTLSFGRLLQGQIDVTYRCNLRCQHCFIEKENKKELQFSQIIRILDEIYAADCIWLCFSGGEPFLREDFLDIYTYARKKGFLITIFTNGTLITPKIVRYLAKFPPFSIEITLNGITQPVYEKVTRIPCSFKKAMQAVRSIKENRLPLVLKCNGMSINKDEILKIKEFSNNLLGKNHFRFDPVLYPSSRRSKRPCRLRLGIDEILNIEHSDNDMLAQCQRDSFNFKDKLYPKIEKLFPCGLTGFNIDPYGRLRLCTFIREPHADIKKEGVLEGFQRLYFLLHSLNYKAEVECRTCKIKYLCRQCPGRALAENGDMEAPVGFFCELAHKKDKMEGELFSHQANVPLAKTLGNFTL